mmetsp:Transcript_17108/g.44555  ORF Transcript_17108/g.44555 Transcript_17108/m.44555 type:complete len:239 (+) Transcript_17108:60-776(+)
MDVVDLLRLMVLISLLPLQLWLTNQTAPADVGRIRTFTAGGYGWLSDVRETLTVDSVSTAAGAPVRLLRRIAGIGSTRKSRSGGGGEGGAGEDEAPPKSRAVEVERHEWFAGSRRARTSRRGVKFRVGQVFIHKKYRYRGVIVGWDAVPKAPEKWFKQMGVPRSLRHQPMYSVLVDVRDRAEANSRTYVNEANIELLETVEDSIDFQHPDMKKFFLGFVTRMKIWEPVPALRKRYPMD